MPTRRHFLAGAAALAVTPVIGRANPSVLISQTEFPRLPRRLRPRRVRVGDEFEVGMIYVFNEQFHLYHVTEPNRAMRYGVAIGGAHDTFTGEAVITRKAEWPSWRPTANMIATEPDVYGPYAAGLPGGHQMNPMGAAALYMNVNGRPTAYRIHGTNLPTTIGTGFSSGCIRLRNDHMQQLYEQVPVGTRMLVV